MASTLTAVKVFLPIALCTLSAVVVLLPVASSTLSAVTMFAQTAEVLCRPSEYFRICSRYSLGRRSAPSCSIAYSVGRQSTPSFRLVHSVGRRNTCAKRGSILSAARLLFPRIASIVSADRMFSLDSNLSLIVSIHIFILHLPILDSAIRLAHRYKVASKMMSIYWNLA